MTIPDRHKGPNHNGALLQIRGLFSVHGQKYARNKRVL